MNSIIEAKILVSRNFARRSFFGDFNVASKVILNNEKEKTKKEYLLYVHPEKHIVEIACDENVEKKKLKNEERAAIIEQILYEYCTLWNSIVKGTVRLDMSKFYLVDTTNKVIRDLDDVNRTNEHPILIEYLESKRIKSTSNPIFILLKKLDDVINKGRLQDCKIAIDSKLKFLNKKDFIYFANCLLELKWLDTFFKVSINKENTKIEISRKN